MQTSRENLAYLQEVEEQTVEKMRAIVSQPLDGAFPTELLEVPAFERSARLTMGLIYLVELITGHGPDELMGINPFQMLDHAAHELTAQQVRYDHMASVLAELHLKVVGGEEPHQYLSNGSLDFEFWAFLREQAGKTVAPSDIADEILAVLGKSEAEAA
jgi:hypothetical protein